MRASFLFPVLVACGVHQPPPVATPVVATAIASAPPPSPPPVAGPQLVVFHSREEIPEAVRTLVPAKVDFRTEALVGMLVANARTATIVERPAIERNTNGALQVVGYVVREPPQRRNCPGGIATREVPVAPTSARVAPPPNFLIVVDVRTLEGARTFDVAYENVIEDGMDPKAPCPPYP